MSSAPCLLGHNKISLIQLKQHLHFSRKKKSWWSLSITVYRLVQAHAWRLSDKWKMQFLQILIVLGHLAFLSNADSPFLRPHIVGSWLMHLFYVPRTADRCHKRDVSKEFSAFITTILPPFLGTTNSPWLGRDSIGWYVTNAPKKSLQSILILIQPIELNYDHSIVLLL